MWTPIRRVSLVKMRKQKRPERLSAILNQDSREVVSEDAKTLFIDLADLFTN